MATDMTRPIQVTPVLPPIPDKRWDYRATFDSYEPGEPQGFGATPEEAVADLIEQEQES